MRYELRASMSDNNKIQSIEDLISFSAGNLGNDESAQQKFSEKHGEINRKEMERSTMQKAAGKGIPYVDLSGFAVSSDALSIIDEQEAIKLSAVCFYYDGQKIRLAAINQENSEVKDLLNKLK